MSSIKNFYDDVVPLTASERRAIDEIPNVDQKLLEQFGVAQSEHPESRIELQHNRPTLSVVGLSSGTVGTGRANAISGNRDRPHRDPAGERARAKTQIRSPDRPHPRAGLSRRRSAPPDMATRRKYPKIARVTRTGRRVPDRQRIDGRSAHGDGRQRDPCARSAPGADADDRRQPAVLNLRDALSMPTIGLAVVNFDNNQHAVNENLRVGHLWEAIDIFAALVTMQK